MGLAYNSQNWRQDNGADLKLGGDVGYGFGWQMQIGSITPYTAVTQSATATDHYVYTDGTGAQYRLYYSGNGVWLSPTQSVYAFFDAAANRLHFRDGSFWVMGCTSSSGEADADTMYPTTVEDVNGNQVLIVYKGGAGIPSAANNTSARIATITDVRAPSGQATYYFSYNSDAPVPHLAGITNGILTAETFNFTYAGAALGPPFGTDSSWAGQTTSHLATMNVPSTGNYQFTYDSAGAGELGQVTFPYGGHLRWVYENFQYAGGRTLREVSARYLAADSAGAVEWGPYTITHPDAANSVAVHSSTTLTDASGNGAKTWNFLGGGSPGWEVGLISDFTQKAAAGSTYGITHDYYAWSQNAGGHPYISAKDSVMDEGTANQQSALTTQAQDGYGNTTQSVVYPFNNTSTPLQTYNSSYLNATGYWANYIFNRLLTTTLTTGGAVKTLVTNYYDGQLASGQSYPNYTGCPWVFGSAWLPSGSIPSAEFDSSQPVPWTSRGQVSLSMDPAKYTCYEYYGYGFASAWASDGTSVTASSNSSTNYAAPSTITTQSYGETIAYNSWLGVTQTTGLNGETLYLSYDSYGRPTTATSPYGAVTSYSYSAAGTYPAQQTKSGPDGFTRTTLDGLGRTIRVERGYSVSNIQSVVDTVYAPCACSPLGKIQKVSAPYPSGQSASNWTVYGYDGIGRTVSTVQPDGASTTTYSYAGNQTTVTDAAGKWKTFTNDVLGNLVSVVEPDPANQPGGTLTTSYTYDWMNHLSGVSMPRSSGTQTRTFVYDDAGRLTSATNPENGTVSYYYNSTNTLQYKHDAKGQDTVYTYDTQNRVTEIQRYANGKNNAEDMCQRVTYSYDTNPYDTTGKYQYTTGRLTAAVYPVCNVLDSNSLVTVTEMYSYHPAGAVTIKDLHIYKPWFNTAFGGWSDGWGDVEADYSYNTAGQTSSLVLPSTLVPSGCCASAVAPVTYTYGYDSMARPVSMVDNNPNSNNGYSTTWAQNVSYDFAGRLSSWQRHTGVGYDFDTSVAETLRYNVNGQLTSMNWSYQDPTYGTWPAATGIQYVYSGSQNNGQITQAVETWSGQNISYQYDALKRLISAASTPTGSGAPAAWTETMQYDGFGNLTAKVLNGSATSIPVNSATNRLSNASYDANGNMTSGAGATLVYDEANRIVSAAEYSGGTEYYAYAPDGKRMFRMEADGVTQEWTFWGARGEKLGTFTMADDQNGAPPLHPYLNPTLSFAGKTIWDGGKPLVQDRIGTNRATGARYYPFGDEITSTANDATKFGTYRRDGFTGLDYADQRYYASGYGRFNSPDPFLGSAAGKSPGTWNRYAYTAGDPVNSNDPSGRCAITTYYSDGNGNITVNCVDFSPSGGGSGTTQSYQGPLRNDPTPLNLIQLKAFAGVLQTQVANGQFSDCQGLAQYADAAGAGATKQQLDKDFGIFVPDTAETTLAQIPVSSSPIAFVGVASGFQSQYQNTNGDMSDQTHHFAAFFELGYQWGLTAASTVGELREFIESFTDKLGYNQGDVNLAYQAALLGSGLSQGSLLPDEIGQMIRTTICK